MKLKLFNLRTFIFLLSTFCLILMYSCEGCSDKNPASPSNSANLNLIIRMPESYSKKSNEMVTVTGVTGIKVTLTSQGKETITVDVPLDTGRASVSVSPGTWTISVVVTTNDGLTFTGSNTINIAIGEVKDVTVSVDVNRPPVIERMWADSTSLRPGESTTVHIRATDRDGDSLSYSCGGPDFTWTAPATSGDHRVSCRVDDGHGGITDASIIINVQRNRNPVITGMAPAEGTIFYCNNATITVSAYDPDGHTLNYQWSATSGTFAGSGSSVTYINTCSCQLNCLTTITVTVTDNYGGNSSLSYDYLED